ncbi:MAG: hypothetical protein JO366_04455 [Methylobacteriaceae bacterium]|nr:hypothetical protein [Methylobacteriaceae bacterium]
MTTDRNDRDSDRGEGAQRGPGPWLALIFVLALAGLAVLVVNEIIKQVNIQNCILSGRKDCVEIVPGK